MKTLLCIALSSFAIVPQSEPVLVEREASARQAIEELRAKPEDHRDIESGLDTIVYVDVQLRAGIPVIEQYLTHADSDIRSQTVEAIVSLGADRDQLVRLLEHADSGIRAKTAEVLLERGDQGYRFPGMLHDESPAVRVAVVTGLLKFERVEPSRVRWLLKDKVPEVRAATAKAMLKAGAQTAEFVSMLQDPSPVVRSTLIEALNAAEADVSLFEPFINDADRTVRLAAANPLAYRRTPPHPKAVVEIIEAAKGRGEFSWAPSEAERLAESMGPQTRTQLIPTALIWIGSGSEVREKCGKIILQHPDGFSPQNAATIQRVINEDRKKVALISFLVAADHSDENVRFLKRVFAEVPLVNPYIDTIAQAGWTQLLPELRECYKSRRELTRIAAATAVAKLDPNDTECVQILIDNYDGTKQQRTEAICSGLATAGDRALAASDILWQALDPPYLVRVGRRKYGQYGLYMPSPRYLTTLKVLRSLSDSKPLLRQWLEDSKTTYFRLEQILTLVEEDEIMLGIPNQAILDRMGESKISQLRQLVFDYVRANKPTSADLQGFVRPDYPTRCIQIATALAANVPAARERAIAELKKFAVSPPSETQVEACTALLQLQADKPFVRKVAREILADCIQRWMNEGPPDSADYDKVAEWDQNDVLESTQFWTLMKQLGDEKWAAKKVGLLLEKQEAASAAIRALFDLGEPAIPQLIAGLRHSDSEIRSACVECLRDLEAQQAVPHLIDLLDDRAYFTVVMSHFGGLREVRLAALEALRDLECPESLIPRLVQLLNEPACRDDAAAILGNFGPKARRAVRPLIRASQGGNGSYEIDKALATISDSPLALGPLRTWLTGPFPNSIWSGQRFELIADLGERGRVFIPRLREIVTGEQVAHESVRIHAAYALARLEPHEPKWRTYLERRANLSRVYSYRFEAARECLARLKEQDGQGEPK